MQMFLVCFQANNTELKEVQGGKNTLRMQCQVWRRQTQGFFLSLSVQHMFFALLQYHKEIVRLMSGEFRRRIGDRYIAFARKWMNFVLTKCESGRGTRPRWVGSVPKTNRVLCSLFPTWAAICPTFFAISLYVTIVRKRMPFLVDANFK